MKARYKRTYVAFMLSIVRFTMTMLSPFPLALPRIRYMTFSKLNANNSVFTTAFKQFCAALYFSVAIEIKEIMGTNNYHMSNTARGSASNKNHQFCVG